VLALLANGPKMNPKHSRSLQNFLKDHSNIKTIACQEPLEWQKSTIRRRKTRENNENPSIRGINIDKHSNHQIWLINGPDLISESQSTKEIGGYWHGLYGTCDNNH